MDCAQFDNAATIFTAGQHVADDLIEYYGVAPNRAIAVGGGVNFSLSATKPDIWTGPPRILFVGKDFERKGGNVLLEAFRTVRQQIPDCELVIVGEQVASDEPNVRSLGTIVDRKELSHLYRESSVFCLPALFEPYGLVLQEAIAHGVPCVATRICSIPEILDSGRAGALVDPYDANALAKALCKVLADREYAESLSEHAWSHIHSTGLTWNHVADRIIARLVLKN
ncbi:glycosyltransferase family 4 protein [Pseudonocardia oroxyli]|nr:glycosyltransferase family 4 protein [Pseudonocardia oroxyli]